MYTPHTWVANETITAEKLNHIETGIANAGGILVVTDTEGTLDKTWQEIHDSMPCVCIEKGNFLSAVVHVEADESIYVVVVFSGPTAKMYTSTSASGYPSYQ